MFRFSHPASWTFHWTGAHAGGAAAAWPAPAAGLPGGPAVPRPAPPWKTYPGLPSVALPEPALPARSLGEAIAGRLSCRRFAGEALALADLSSLLYAAYGVLGRTRVDGIELWERPVPSGGARYPLELYLLVRRVADLETGVFHYAPREHRLAQLRGPLPWAAVTRLFLDQTFLARAAAIAVLTAVVERTLEKYGDRGLRYVYMEAGHVAQNLNLTSAALGLGSLDVGGFYDDQLAPVLGVDPEAEVPVYAVALGPMSTTDRAEARSAGVGC